MKVAVLGSGAMGSIYAGLFAEAGHIVWAIDIWKDHIDAINTVGLKIEGASGNRIIKGIIGSDNLMKVDKCDLYIIATKASAVSSVASSIKTHMDHDALVLTIQNGLVAGERVAKYISTKNILIGVADGFGASLKGPGHVHHHAMKLIRIGEMEGGRSARLRKLEEVWHSVGFNVQSFENIEQLVWEKFICNVTFSAPCTVFECDIETLMSNQETWGIALACAMEAHAIAEFKNVHLSFKDPKLYVTEFGKKLGNSSPSMRLDHISRRPSEINAINGMVETLGKEVGISTPYNKVVSAIVRSREEAFK